MKARDSNAFDTIQKNVHIKQSWKHSQKINFEHYLNLKKIKKDD